MSHVVSALALIGSFFALCACGIGALYVFVVLGMREDDPGRAAVSGGTMLICALICFAAATLVKALI